ncbi:nitrogen fixation protein NifZ [Frankia sp. CcI156]|jgi:nitrogen fixation protein NifZ|uniref:NifZ n=1 Tax=Frankia casuarinae (strain DSM 45818 / CECT 9043 / HFP020203 / CcI3) TaxID=106370 RepID=Q2J4G7_FRACC|nr:MULTISPECIES: nitrogen fixation protein NifZ [Frankia]ABD13825.1 NifZ [Frankia casuarinae]ETA04030.1 hypothetical protein CcI6DRAFT_00554 [Frankia sp. CcI6]EYT94276.1 hypothetical protein ThrDRAFT_00203 [Frankia casuarinae]KDA44203.1 hypothetical protein BMG523Draft_01002 [Frankia sp. BMG5.23]KEZ37784.1 NifZ domain-containing protein [Frankia sp. CeD]
MNSTYDVGDIVVAVKALRNDGTYPDPAIAVGEVLVEAGTRGQVINVGLYLQEHIVYAVAFDHGRIVGALERELVSPEQWQQAAAVAAGTAAPAATTTATSSATAPATGTATAGGKEGRS